MAAVLIGLAALVFTLWPLIMRKAERRAFLALPPDARAELVERKRAALRALRELDFEHGAGHVSEADYADLRSRYEAEAAEILGALDRLEPRPAPAPPVAAPARLAARSAWQRPVFLGAGAVVLVAFGIAIGAGIVRHTAPEPSASAPMPGGRPLAQLSPPSATSPDGAAPRPIAPEMLGGMLRAARTSLFEGRYNEAIAAYQAILKRDPKNVDAITHRGVIVAIGGHADAALESFNRALAIDPDYPPALLYRGQVLYEVKQDAAEAIRSWERFLAVAPAGEDRDRVATMIAEAKSRGAARAR